MYYYYTGPDYGGYHQQQNDYNYDRGRGRGRGSRGGGRGYASGGGGRGYDDFKEPSPGAYPKLKVTAMSVCVCSCKTIPIGWLHGCTNEVTIYTYIHTTLIVLKVCTFCKLQKTLLH